MRKVRIRTILGFGCTNLGSELLRNNPRIAHVNLGSEDLLRKPLIRGFAAQTSDPHAIFWDRAAKPRPSVATNPQSIAHAKQLFAAQTSVPHAIFWDRATKPRPSAAKKPRSIAHAKQLGHPRQRGFLRARSIVGLLPRMAEVWLRDPR